MIAIPTWPPIIQLPHPDTARDARLGQNDAIIANDHIMGDMNLIIDHHIRAKMRVIKNAPVNGHACTNITALTRHHPAKMRNKTGFCPLPFKAKSAFAQDCILSQAGACAQDGMAQPAMRRHMTVGPR